MLHREPRVRLRQAVLLASDLEPLAAQLRSTLGLAEPFRDPGVGEFGLANVVFALGDCFIEIVSPIKPDTAAGRHLARHGDGGYMALFDIEDLAAARERTRALGVRVVWQIDLPDIAGTHLHPADMRGAIVSLDRSDPYGTWRWGGPQWTGQIGTGAPGSLAGITVAVADPAAVAARWAEVLGVRASGESAQPTLALENTQVRFERAVEDASEGISEIAVRTPAELPGGAEVIELGGVRLRRLTPTA
jgi:Glyoxalase-like domain